MKHEEHEEKEEEEEEDDDEWMQMNRGELCEAVLQYLDMPQIARTHSLLSAPCCHISRSTRT